MPKEFYSCMTRGGKPIVQHSNPLVQNDNQWSGAQSAKPWLSYTEMHSPWRRSTAGPLHVITLGVVSKPLFPLSIRLCWISSTNTNETPNEISRDVYIITAPY